MTAGPADLTVEQAATWRRTVAATDDDGTAVTLTAPAWMDIRAGRTAQDELVLRLDSAGTVGAGTITAVAGVLTLLAGATLTAALDPGDYWYDLFATAGTDTLRLLAGRVTVVPAVSVVTP